MRLILIAAAALATSGACAADSVYGLRIGEPLPYPVCARLPITLPNYEPPYAPVTATCAKPAGPDNGIVAFPVREPAAHAVGGDVGYRLIDGRLHLVIVTTAGAPAQQAVMRDLEAKYGPPASSSGVPVANATGGQAESIVARWAQPGLQVEFVGIAGRFDTGRILIGTPAGHAAFAKAMDAATGPARKL